MSSLFTTSKNNLREKKDDPAFYISSQTHFLNSNLMVKIVQQPTSTLFPPFFQKHCALLPEQREKPAKIS